jgi:bifunctional UDP-N-acetylglucosamine pyrophosphorylase/glucosamine-1-phosphate N-acetyltransferase
MQLNTKLPTKSLAGDDLVVLVQSVYQQIKDSILDNRLRPGTKLEENSRVGNFVEVKNTTLGPEAKANHLTYLGDATIGAGANIGAGTITCNYDGYTKSHTDIGDGAFIGSNTALVAPVKVGAGAITAAGSVITNDVAPDALAIARGVQTEKPGWAKAFRAQKQEISKGKK